MADKHVGYISFQFSLQVHASAFCHFDNYKLSLSLSPSSTNCDLQSNTSALPTPLFASNERRQKAPNFYGFGQEIRINEEKTHRVGIVDETV